MTFAYEGNGNRTQMTDGQGTETSTYDTIDRLTGVTRGSNTFSYVYDLANRTQVTYPGGTSTSYAYDDEGRLASATSSGLQTTYAYDEAANLRTTTLPSAGQLVETRTYDRAGRLSDVESKRGSTIRAKFAITRDPVGNPSQIVRTGALAQTQAYTYDALDRLTGVCFQTGTCPGGSDPFVRWSYDGVGNRLSEVRPTGTTTSTYNAADELTQAGTTAYTYDQNGNELSAGSRTFAYDLANRLKTTTLSSTTTTYLYDGLGKRLQASTGTAASAKTNFLWDVNRALPQVALERNGNNVLQRQYTYGHERIQQTVGTQSYYLYDGLGSVVNTTSSTGTVQRTWSYEPFGAIRTQSGTSPANFWQFTGEYADPTGLYHLRARQYDPGTGRFLMRDPIAVPLTTAGSAYVYVTNRPTELVDPSGRIGIGVSGCAHIEVAFGVFVSGKVCVHGTASSSGIGFGTSHTGTGGVGWKAGVDVGGSTGLSNAECISDYEGESYSGGVAIGPGARGDVTVQRGPSARGRQITEVSLGLSGGLAAAAGPHFERNQTTVDRSVSWNWGEDRCNPTEDDQIGGAPK